MRKQTLGVLIILIMLSFLIIAKIGNVQSMSQEKGNDPAPIMSHKKLLSEIGKDVHMFYKPRYTNVKSTDYLRQLVKEAEQRGLSNSKIVKGAKTFLDKKKSGSIEYKEMKEKIDIAGPMNFVELAKKRGSIRVFLDKKIPHEIITILLETAIEAPSSCNRQAWRFLIIEDKKSKDFIASWKPEKFVEDAPLVICVLVDTSLYYPSERQTGFMDCSAAIMNIIYAAESMGLNSCWVNSSHNERKREAFLQYFKLDKDLLPISFVVLGYGNQHVKKMAREPVEYYILK